MKIGNRDLIAILRKQECLILIFCVVLFSKHIAFYNISIIVHNTSTIMWITTFSKVHAVKNMRPFQNSNENVSHCQKSCHYIIYRYMYILLSLQKQIHRRFMKIYMCFIHIKESLILFIKHMQTYFYFSIVRDSENASK